MTPHGKWQDRWLDHPFPSINEPEKSVAYLTDLSDHNEDHQAWLYSKCGKLGYRRLALSLRSPTSQGEEYMRYQCANASGNTSSSPVNLATKKSASVAWIEQSDTQPSRTPSLFFLK